ncbi:MAG: DUF4349 domain-containing protein [Novosphingobium sp.]
MLIAGCSKPANDTSGDHAATPRVGISSAPGVSLTYLYGFRLPVERIASVQEEHAAQCEALAAPRCRIVGMTYDVSRDRTVTASIQFKLAPEMARHFGKQGVDAVVKRGGMLASSKIESEESGTVIADAERDRASVEAERSRIEKQLAQPNLGSPERIELQAKLSELANAIRESQTTRSEAASKLASTPMTFIYESGDVDLSLSDGPILGAIKDGWSNIVAGFALILMMLITVLPWIGTLALIVWLWRRFGARLGSRREPNDEQ